MKLLQKHRTATLCAVCMLYSGLLLARPSIAVAALRDGLVFCAERLIPSLLPFLFIAALMLNSGAAELLGGIFSPLTRRLFRLPEISAPVILMSLTGGYPVGIRLVADLVKTRQITEQDARRMTRFCLNAGPAFVVLGIGQGLLGSTSLGWISFAALASSSLLIGLLLPRAKEEIAKKEAQFSVEKGSISTMLTSAINSAAEQMLQICVWTLLFDAICAYLPLVIHNQMLLVTVKILLEVTSGTQAVASLNSLPLITAALAWGGFCVHVQVLDPLRRCGQGLGSFMLWRLAHAAIAALLCRALLIVFPVEMPALSISVSATPIMEPWQLSAPSALGLAAMGVGLLSAIRSKREADPGA